MEPLYQNGQMVILLIPDTLTQLNTDRQGEIIINDFWDKEKFWCRVRWEDGEWDWYPETELTEVNYLMTVRDFFYS